MPTYRFTDPYGRSLKVTGPSLPTEAEVDAMFADLYPGPPPTPAVSTSALSALIPPAEEGGVLETLKQGGTAALELLGRPGEFVSGFVGGAAQGGLGEGLRRGASAAFEGLGEGQFLSRLADSQQQESFSKVMEEQGILKDSPTARAVAGFAGDVLFDPLSLLGGAGILRRGLIKGAGTLGKAAEAERALTATNRAFAAATAPLAEKARVVAAKTPGLKAFTPYANLVGLKGASGADAQELMRLSAARTRARVDVETQPVDTLVSTLSASLRKALPKYSQTDLDQALSTLSAARAQDPTALAQVAGSPDLQRALQSLTPIYDDLEHRELFTKAIRQPYLPVELGGTKANPTKYQDALNALPRTGLRAIQQALQAGTVSNLPNTAKAPLQRIATAIVDNLKAADGTMLYDPKLVRLQKLPTGEVTVEKFNSLLNYVPLYLPGKQQGAPATIFRAVNPELKEARERTLSFAEGVAAGAETNIADITRRRIASNVRAEENARLISQLDTEFGQSAPQVGYRQFSKAMQQDLENIPALAPLKDRYLPNAIADELEKQVAILNDPERVEGIFRRMGKLWKGFATSLNVPAYPATNFLGNTLAMHLAGMGLDQIGSELNRSYKGIRQADTILNAPTPSHEVFKLKHFTDQEVLQLAQEYGTVGRSGSFATEFRAPDQMSETAQALTTGRLNPLNPEAEFYNVVRGAGQRYVEDPAKLALFVHELRKLDTAKALTQAQKLQAVDNSTLTVMKYLFNYGDLSPMEQQRLAGNLIPFYTFTRKNTPLYLASLALRPGKVAQQNRLINLINTIGSQDPEAQQEFEEALPSYLREPGMVRLRSLGTTPVRGRLKFPLMDINRPFNLLENPKGSLGEMLAPGVRIPIEMLSGETLRGAPIREGYGRPTPVGNLLGLAGELPSGERVQGNLSRYLSQQFPLPAQSMLTGLLAEPRAGSTQPLPENILMRALGVAPTELTPDIYEQGRRERIRRKAERTRARRDQQIAEALK